MECELCGKAISGKPTKIRIEGVVLLVCSDCARKYSEFIVKRPQARAPRPTRRLKRTSLSYEPQYDIVEDYSERIKEAREMLGLTRELLARELGEKESVIRRLEAGSLVPTIDMARRLERLLRIKLLVPKGYEEEPSITTRSVRPELTLGDIVVIRERRERKRREANEGGSSR